ncbi:hypothetical protein LWI29_009056 [Acer saccharum]|uniref:Mechanosensitive ion channel MscS domain-containing protein n=1 Tax=Acer saccharum TaxID=4024 RepID=A0AA39VT62_ACESA|nr:hypothetical protein LWI29_009056 [Acer saccharum]
MTTNNSLLISLWQRAVHSFNRPSADHPSSDRPIFNWPLFDRPSSNLSHQYKTPSDSTYTVPLLTNQTLQFPFHSSPSLDPISPISPFLIHLEGSSSSNSNDFAHTLFQNSFGFRNKNFQTLLFSLTAFYSWQLMGAMFDWVIVNYKDKHGQEDEAGKNQHTSVLSISLFYGLFLATLEIWGISNHSALVTDNILGALISFASKDVFENFLNGLWLRFLEPYKLGDYIVVKSEKFDGKVMDIRLISITIIDKKLGAHVVVPYTFLSQNIIFNVS